MKIKNTSTVTQEIGDLKQPTGTGKGVILAPGAEITIYDEDAEKSVGLKALITAGSVTKTGDLEPGETTVGSGIELVDKIAAWVIAGDTTLQWLNHSGVVATTDAGTYAAAAAARTVTLEVVNAGGIVDTLNSVSTALITVTGTATGVSLNGTAYTAPVTLTLTNGVCPVLIASTDSGSKTVVLTITSCTPSGLTHSAVMTYSFS